MYFRREGKEQGDLLGSFWDAPLSIADKIHIYIYIYNNKNMQFTVHILKSRLRRQKEGDRFDMTLIYTGALHDPNDRSIAYIGYTEQGMVNNSP